MLRELSSVLILLLLLFGSVGSVVSAAPPAIRRPMEVIKATIEGGVPETVDPAWTYDSASSELIMQVYEPLVVFNGECFGSYIPALATTWTVENITGETSPEGLDWYFRYTFEIRVGVQWHDPAYGTLTTSDVEYSFERAMVQERHYGPQWMLYEPLLNSWGTEGLGYNLSIPLEAAIVGRIIDHAVESNSTHVWFNLVFPGAYPPFMQILSQVWGSVLCRAWIINYVIGTLGRPDWDGVWGDYTGWVAYNEPTISPLDDPTPVMMGCGPFEYGTLDYTLEQWDVNRFVNYWRGWPIDWPAMAGAQPAGYIDHYVVTWAFHWEVRKALLLAGDVDFCAVPHESIDEIVGEDGVRCVLSLPKLSVSGFFFNYKIDPMSPFGPILPAGTFNESGVPTDFFGNPVWGVHVRRAFAFALDYEGYANNVHSGRASHSATAIIPSVTYHDSSVHGYTYNLSAAMAEFQAVPELWNAGFTLILMYTYNNQPSKYVCESLKTSIESLNAKFHINVVHWDWRHPPPPPHQWPHYIIGLLADFPDAHSFAFNFYHSQGALQLHLEFSIDPVLDALIDQAIRTPDGEARAAMYHDVQKLAIQICPSFTLPEPFKYHFERDWMQGWYYNPSYPGLYAANLWKWYYVEEALQSTAAHPYSNRLPVDVNYDGKVDLKDVGVAANSFGTAYGPPAHPRWIFRADINNDRKIDFKDIGRIAKNFGKTSAVWTPS